MSYGNSGRRKHSQTGEHIHLDLGRQCEGKINEGSQKDFDIYLDPDLPFSVRSDLDLGSSPLPNHPKYEGGMKKPLDLYEFEFEKNNSSINEFDDLKTTNTKRCLLRLHPTDGGDEETAHTSEGRLGRRRSRSSLAQFSQPNGEGSSWDKDGQLLGANQRSTQPGFHNILKVPAVDLMSNNEVNMQAWTKTNRFRVKSPKPPEGAWQPELEEEPDWQLEPPNSRLSRLVSSRPNSSPKMRPSSEPPRLRLSSNHHGYLDKFKPADELKHHLWKMPVETAYTLESRRSSLSYDPVPSVNANVETNEDTRNVAARKKRKSSPKDKKTNGIYNAEKLTTKHIKTKAAVENHEILRTGKEVENYQNTKNSGDTPCVPGYVPLKRDNMPFKRNSKTFQEIRASNPALNSEETQHKRGNGYEDKANLTNTPQPCQKSYSPSLSREKSPFKRSSSPSPPIKKSEVLKPSFSPKAKRSSDRKSPKTGKTTSTTKEKKIKTNQRTPTKSSNSDFGAFPGDPTSECYPGYSPPSQKASRSPSKSSVKPLKSPNKKGKTQTKEKSPNSRPKSPSTKKAHSTRSATKNNRSVSPCPRSRSRSRQASPVSSQTRCPPTYPPPCDSSNRLVSNRLHQPQVPVYDLQRAIAKSPSNSSLKKSRRTQSPPVSSIKSNASLRSGNGGVRKEPSWGSLADTMPMQPSFLPTFYDDIRASPPSPRMNSASMSQVVKHSSGPWQNDYPKMDSPPSMTNNAPQGTFSNLSMGHPMSGIPQKSPSRNTKTKSGSHKSGKRGKRNKKDKNENKQHRTKSGKKRSSKAERSGAQSYAGSERCVPPYNPCINVSPRSEKADSQPRPKQVEPKKESPTTPKGHVVKSRLGALCRKCKEFSPKAKVNIRWPGPCRRRCGQSMPRLGMFSRIGEAFGSQLRTIASNRFAFPGFTPLYISDAGPEEWFHYPEVGEAGESGPSSRTPSRVPSSRPASEKPSAKASGSRARPSGFSSGSAGMVTADEGEISLSQQEGELEAGGDLEGSDSGERDDKDGSQAELSEERLSDRKESKRGLEELQETEAQCYRMRATVRSNKEVVEVNLEECNGVMCRSKRSCHGQRQDGNRRTRVGHRRNNSKDSQGSSRGIRRDGSGGGTGGGSRRASSNGRGGSGSKKQSSTGKGPSPKESPRQQSPSLQKRETDYKLGDSEQHKTRRKRHASPSSLEDDSSVTEERYKRKKGDRTKQHGKQNIKVVAESKSPKRSRQTRKEASASEGSGTYSITNENTETPIKGNKEEREGRCRRIVVSSDNEQNVKVRCVSSDSDKDCKLVSTCRSRRYRGTRKHDHDEKISESDEIQCKEFMCGEKSLVKVCTASPHDSSRARNQPVESSNYDDSANWSGSNIQTSKKHRQLRSSEMYPENKKSPIRQLPISEVSSGMLDRESRGLPTHRSPSDSLVHRKASCENERKARAAPRQRTVCSDGSPVDPNDYKHKQNYRSPLHTRHTAGDEVSPRNLKTKQSSSYVTTPASRSTSRGITPSYPTDSEGHREYSNSYDSGSDRDNHLAKVIKGRMKFLSLDDGSMSGDMKYAPSKTTSVGITNGTVKMSASPKNMKIIRCDVDGTLKRSAEDGFHASLRTSAESFAVEDEDFFVSRPNPDPTSIARYERDSKYIRMRQQRLERLERSMDASDPDSIDFVPKSQYLNRVSRRKRSQGRLISPRRRNGNVTSHLARGEKSGGDTGQPELLDQFSRIITPEQALRLAEARNVVTTDSDASGLLSEIYKKPLISHRNNSQNNDGDITLRENRACKPPSNVCPPGKMEHQSRVLRSQGDIRCISDDRFLTPPSINWEDSLARARHGDNPEDFVKATVPSHYQTNNSSAHSPVRTVGGLTERNKVFRNDVFADKNFQENFENTQTENSQESYKSACASQNDKTLKNRYKFKYRSPIAKADIKADRKEFSSCEFSSSRNHVREPGFTWYSDISQSSDKPHAAASPGSKQSLHRSKCITEESEYPATTVLSPTVKRESPARYSSPKGEKVFLSTKVNNLGSDSGIHRSVAESGFAEEDISIPGRSLNMAYTDGVPLENRDINQSSNTDDASATNPGLTGDPSAQIGAIDTLRLSSPHQLESFSRRAVPVESLSSCNAGSPAVRQYGHLGHPLRSNHSSRLAASVTRPKKYFADSESEWSITSDEDHLIQMAKSLPAIFPHRLAEDRIYEKIRRNSMRALIYAASISNLSSNKTSQSKAADGDGPLRSMHKTQKVKSSPDLDYQPKLYSSQKKGFNNNQNSVSLKSEKKIPGYGEVKSAAKECTCEELTEIPKSSQKEFVNSSTSCHLLPVSPSQFFSKQADTLKNTKSSLMATMTSSVDRSDTEPSPIRGFPKAKPIEEPVSRLANQAFLQSVKGPSQSDVMKLCTEDGEEFWILSAEAMKRLNVFPSGYSRICDTSNSDDNREYGSNVKPCSLSSNSLCLGDGLHQRQEEQGLEPSPPVYDEELDNDANQNKSLKEVRSQESHMRSSKTLETKSYRSNTASCPKSDPESCGLWSASKPCYFLDHEDCFNVPAADRNNTSPHWDSTATGKLPELSSSFELKHVPPDSKTKLVKVQKSSKKKGKKCNASCGTNVNFSHISNIDSVSKHDLTNTSKVAEEVDQRVLRTEPKSSSVDPHVLKRKKNRRRYFSSVDPPCFDTESNCPTEDKSSCDNHRQGIPNVDESVGKRDRGDQIGTDLDQAILNHLKVCCGLEGNKILRNSKNISNIERCDIDCEKNKTKRFTSLEPNIRADHGKTRSSAKRHARSISKSSKSTQTNDTLSLVSSATLSSEEDCESLADTIFDKPSVVVVSLSSKGGGHSPIRAIDNFMPKHHKSVLLEWLKTVVPNSLLPSSADKDGQCVEREEGIKRKRGSSEPRKSHTTLSRSHRRAASASRADRFQDNSSNALTTTDLSIGDTSPLSQLMHNSPQTKVKRHRKKKKSRSSENAVSKEYGRTEQLGDPLPALETSISPLSSPKECLGQVKNKKKMKSSMKMNHSGSPQKPELSKAFESPEPTQRRKEKSCCASQKRTHKDREARSRCGNADFSSNHSEELCVSSENETSEEGDHNMSQSLCPAKTSSRETDSSFLSNLNLNALRERFDKLVADLDNVYNRDGNDTKPQVSLAKPYDMFLEMSMRDDFKNLGLKYIPSSSGEGETAPTFFRRREPAMSFNSEFLRDFNFDTVLEPVSREEGLMRQYSHGLSDRRFSGYSYLGAPMATNRVFSDFSGGLRYRRTNFPSARSSSLEAVTDAYPSGHFAGATRFLDASMDETNNKHVYTPDALNDTFSFGNNNDISRVEAFRGASGYSNFRDLSAFIDEGAVSNREILQSNWNENANNGDHGGHNDDSSSKSSTDEDFLEFEMEDRASGAEMPHTGFRKLSTGVDASSESLPNLRSKKIFPSACEEMVADSRLSYTGQAVPRENLFGFLSGAVQETNCMCPTCGCLSNNHQSSRKPELFSRVPLLVTRNINGSGNMASKDHYTRVNIGAATGGKVGDMVAKDVGGGNNRASDEEFVSAIEHLSSTVRNCNNMMPRHIWQECQEMDDTCNHQQDSSFYMGDGPGGLAGFCRIGRDDCLMHIDNERTGLNKLFRGQHSDPDILSSEQARRQPWQIGGLAANVAAPLHLDTGVQSRLFNAGPNMCRSQVSRCRRNGMTQWYQDRSNMETASEGRLIQQSTCNSSEISQSNITAKERESGISSSECSGQNHMCNKHGEIDEEEDEEDEDHEEYEETMEEDDDDEADEESGEDDEDDADDDDEEDGNEDENHNKEVIRHRMPRDLGQPDGNLDTLHLTKHFSETGKQAGDMNIERKVATITNGRFTAGDPAGRQERLADYGTDDIKLEQKCSSDSPRNSIRQKKFSLEQIKVPAIEKERVRFACDESGDWAEIGRGSYGCVYLGLLDGSIEVAIKDFYEASSWELVIHEARMLMYLQDTGITPRLYGLRRRFDVSKQPSEYCIIMEYFGDGRTLFNVMSDKIPLRTDEWLDIVGQLVAGLRLIHRKGVLINDLKADNILVDLTKGRKVIRYIDVGMATYKQGLTFQLPEDQMNRYNFLAPEVREGGRTTTRSDIYR
ncbi:dual specificity protein kinase shkC-like isoform X1 [Elysia marginata]|uniref:Dual specificity protein kinase shkC-like isoform X1 n=1 Tax=Elysia marginata TaxID=1093978 RepID=A0AAV4ECC4_9GAST|nr:dual specificity protein kinase shkC-like isoform X1 [Elysia marginata]